MQSWILFATFNFYFHLGMGQERAEIFFNFSFFAKIIIYRKRRKEKENREDQEAKAEAIKRKKKRKIKSSRGSSKQEGKWNIFITPCFEIFEMKTKMCEEFYYSEHLFHLNGVVCSSTQARKEISSFSG